MAKPTEVTSPGYMQPIVVDRGGNVTLDEQFTVTGSTTPEFATFIHIGLVPDGSTGTVVIEYHNGVVDVWHGRKSDSICPGKIGKVLSTAVVNGVTETTDVSGITWHGGQ